jgi:hypothetical protein
MGIYIHGNDEEIPEPNLSTRDPLAMLGDPSAAWDIITCNSHPAIKDARLCVVCQHEGRASCPVVEKRSGICPFYQLDRVTDPVVVEGRMNEYRESLLSCARSV